MAGSLDALGQNATRVHGQRPVFPSISAHFSWIAMACHLQWFANRSCDARPQTTADRTRQAADKRRHDVTIQLGALTYQPSWSTRSGRIASPSEFQPFPKHPDRHASSVMKLTGKIILVYMVAIALLTILFGYNIVSREDQRLQRELARTAHHIGIAMENELVLAWNSNGHTGVTGVIDRVDKLHREIRIAWVALNVRSPAVRPDMPVAQLAQLEGADHGSVATVMSHDNQHNYYPIDVAEERAGCVQISQPLEAIDRYTWGTVLQTSTLVLGMLACGGVVTLLGIRFVGRPLQQLIAKTKRIGEGDFTEPLELRGHDELNELASALNLMCEKLADQQQKLQTESSARIAAVEQLRHVDRLNTVGRLASGVAHELGTPLNVVSGRAELIASGQLDLEQCQTSAQAIKSEADRMAHIIRQLLDFARRRTPQRTSVNLRDVADQSVELLHSLAKKHQVEVSVRGDATLSAHVDAGQIQQVLTMY